MQYFVITLFTIFIKLTRFNKLPNISLISLKVRSNTVEIFFIDLNICYQSTKWIDIQEFVDTLFQSNRGNKHLRMNVTSHFMHHKPWIIKLFLLLKPWIARINVMAFHSHICSRQCVLTIFYISQMPLKGIFWFYSETIFILN